VPNLDWISDDREGLTFNDATSAVFAMDVDWSKVDVTTYSWQKVMGGEGAHGMLILSPRAVARLESWAPEGRPIPKVFQLAKKGKLDEALFTGATINTPSMICVEDYLDALDWAESIGGLEGLKRRSEANLAAVATWVDETPWAHFLAKDPKTRSNTSVCLTLDTDPANVKKMCALLEDEHIAYDIGAYRDAPPGLRIWCGATVETADVEALLPWIEFAYAEVTK
jgi:phosphoserine aminotransferase